MSGVSGGTKVDPYLGNYASGGSLSLLGCVEDEGPDCEGGPDRSNHLTTE